jgi:hypothetical protein
MRRLGRAIAGLVALIAVGAALLPARGPRPAGAAAPFVVHEWGTFTSRFGPDGLPLAWSPLAVPSDLPRFVYLASARLTRKNTIEGTVRMETPVLYFYADQRLTASVSVGFPDGLVSEWYPRGRRTARGIRWPRVTVLPGASVVLRQEAAPSHYYPARATDAAIVRVGEGSRTQHEKFLFYRGVGTFDLPLGARLDGDSVVVRRTGQSAIGRVLLFQRRDGATGYRAADLGDAELTLARPEPAADAQVAFEAELYGLLVAEGLYPLEAQAMLETWRDTWSADGLRVLYAVPRDVTDRVLPLDVRPAPSEVVRVLVGRADLEWTDPS